MAKKLRHWLQKRLNKTKIFYPEDYGTLSSSQGEFPEYPGASLTEEVHSYASTVDNSLTALKVFLVFGDFLTADRQTIENSWKTLYGL